MSSEIFPELRTVSAGVAWWLRDVRNLIRLALLGEAIDVSRTVGDGAGELEGLIMRSSLAYDAADLNGAVALAQEALLRARQLNLPHATMRLLGQLARVARESGDWQASARFWEEGMELARAVGDTWWTARRLAFGASLRLHDNDRDGARKLLLASMRERQAIGDQEGIASCLEGFAELAAANRQARLVVLLSGAATEIRERLGAPRVGTTRWDGPLEALKWARDTLGPRADELWTAGQSLSVEQAIALAIQPDQGSPEAITVA